MWLLWIRCGEQVSRDPPHAAESGDVAHPLGSQAVELEVIEIDESRRARMRFEVGIPMLGSVLHSVRAPGSWS